MRNPLPDRRHSTTVTFRHNEFDYQMTCGYYSDGHLGEIFLNTTKTSSSMDAIVRDAAILVSMALQHGTPINALRTAMLRNVDNSPATAMGAALDLIMSRNMERI